MNAAFPIILHTLHWLFGDFVARMRLSVDAAVQICAPIEVIRPRNKCRLWNWNWALFVQLELTTLSNFIKTHSIYITPVSNYIEEGVNTRDSPRHGGDVMVLMFDLFSWRRAGNMMWFWPWWVVFPDDHVDAVSAKSQPRFEANVKRVWSNNNQFSRPKSTERGGIANPEI